MAALNVGAMGVGVLMMLPELLPQHDAHQTIVRVGVGMSSNSNDETKGNTPGIHLWDIMGRSVGSTYGSPDILKDGEFSDISIPFDDGVGRVPSEYISVVNGGDDALCIAYLALTQPDGTKKVWWGDVGKRCDADWYASELKTGDDDYKPACIWIDRDGSNGLHFQGFGLHINDFAATQERANQYNSSKDLMCKSDPRFKMYEKMDSTTLIPTFQPPLEYTTKTLTDVDPAAVMDQKRWVLAKLPPEGPPDLPPVEEKRNDKPSPSPSPSPDPSTALRRLIISSSKHHSAQELCDSASSRGPDFISTKEGIFCDMEHKKAYPLCGPQQSSGCFDQKTHSIKAVVVRGRDATTGAPPPAVQKSYRKPEHWD